MDEEQVKKIEKLKERGMLEWMSLNYRILMLSSSPEDLDSLDSYYRSTRMEEAYQIALSHGELDVAYARIVLLGPGGVGKSSLKRGLMGLPFDAQANSTIVADLQSVRHEWAQAGDQWREMTPEDELEELAHMLAIVYHNPRGSQGRLDTAAATSLFAKDMMPSTTKCSQSYVEEVKETFVTKIFSKAMKVAQKMPSTAVSQLKPQPFLHIWDCGGQPVFLEVLPAFLTSRTMFLLLFDASTDLNTRMRSVRYRYGNKITEGETSMTTLELMEGWMSNIHANLMRHNDEGVALEYPRVITVGTRGDKLTAGEKDGVKRTLEERIQGQPFCEVMGKEKVFIVDNTTSGKGRREDETYRYLRKEIDNFTSKKLIVRTPISWVLFRKVLQILVKESKNTIPLTEAVAIGKACNIDPKDVSKVLKFYHELGVVLFYPHIKGLRDKVILSPKWFVDCLGKVLTLEGREEYDQIRDMWDLLREKGILLQPLYAAAWRRCEGVEPEEMIQLLVHFCLAAEVKTKLYYNPNLKQFFVPAVLPTFNGDSSSAIIPGYQLRATPLHITFRTGYVIPGFFTRLVTSMAQQSCSLQFDVAIFRNRITFQCDVNDVILTELPNTIQVDLLRYIPHSSKGTPTQKSCEIVQDLLKTCCQQVKECLQFIAVPIEKEFKFICQGRECNSSSDPHYLRHPPNGIHISCERSRVFRNLTYEEACWFPVDIDAVIAEEESDDITQIVGAQVKSRSPILKKSPERQDAYKLLKKKSANWDDFARDLDIELNFREELQQEGSTRTSGSKLERILIKWIESESSDVTWSNLIEVLEGLEFLDLVREVKSYLEKEEVIEKYSQKEDYTKY